MANPKLKKSLYLIIGALLPGLTIFVSSSTALSTVGASYLYTLSDFTGAVPYMGGTLFIDKERNEAYVLSQNIVTVFNSSGLEVYRFGDNNNLGVLRDLAVDQDGSILLLSYNQIGDKYQIIRCNFRGDPVGTIEIAGPLPRGFRPDCMAYWRGHIYLADSGRLLAAIIDTQGRVERSFDLFALLELEEKDRENAEMDGFTVDGDGNMLFTTPVLFSAHRVSPDGKTASFGKPGSIPGKFGVVSGITADNRGNILVADKLKCVINVYDKNFNFLMEFGHRGSGPGSLIIPQGLAVDSNDRLYVVQAGNRGVSVFRMIYN